jgi:hypothetical protein
MGDERDREADWWKIDGTVLGTWNDYESTRNTDVPRYLQPCQQQPGSVQQNNLNTWDSQTSPWTGRYTDKKEIKIFLIYK